MGVETPDSQLDLLLGIPSAFISSRGICQNEGRLQTGEDRYLDMVWKRLRRDERLTKRDALVPYRIAFNLHNFEADWKDNVVLVVGAVAILDTFRSGSGFDRYSEADADDWSIFGNSRAA